MPAVAVIGSGYWGRNLVRNYHQLQALKVICDMDHSVLGQFAEQYPDVRTCSNFGEALAQEDIQGVVIATPAETHYQLARQALLAGKHVYVEKPLVTRSKEGEDLIALADQKQRVLMVGHLLQYHPIFVCLKELVRKGELGRINYIYSNRLNLGKIRREENILWSFAPHDISMILSLAGEEPESVVATGGNYLHQNIADVTSTHLEFASGLRAHIFVSWLHPFKEQKLVVVGERKMAVFNDTKSWENKLFLYPHQIRWENNIPIPARAEPEKVAIPQDEPLRLECMHFLDCMRLNRRPITDGHEGLRVLKILNASQRSLDLHGQKIILIARSDESGVAPLSGGADRSESQKDYFVHPSAVIDAETEIGAGTRIWHFSHVLSGSRIGTDCNIGQNVVIGPDVVIGRKCKIQNNVSVYKGVRLEDGVFCGPSMVFTNIFNPRAYMRKMDQVRPTLVKEGATLGANCTIVCGVTVGRFAFIGAGAVVTRDVLDYALVAGNPARRIGWACECGESVPDSLQCPVCQKAYALQGDRLVLLAQDLKNHSGS
jgi:UDP-2-acetamido-3-amino-2,3-dideoxy-glucuronate N-acetyltransferase